LTSRLFARKFSFALSKKLKAQLGPIRTDPEENTQQRSASENSYHHQQTEFRAALMKANSWVTYRTRFLVKAKQLTSNLTFTDDLGRQHSGRKGDYLVESSDGVLRIAPRQIFEDIYVPLRTQKLFRKDKTPNASGSETYPISGTTRKRSFEANPPAPHLMRKSPQSEGGRRNGLTGFGPA
jgi:hypothetical protein